MDTLPPDLDKLFEEADNRAVAEEEANIALPGMEHVSVIQCKCGSVVTVSIPTRCPGCGDKKSYWRTADKRVLKISQMPVGHITASIKFLAERCEKTPHILREPLEIALDLLYEELGSRDKETNQLTGIQAALFRSL